MAKSRYLSDFTDLAHRCREFGGGGLPEFLDTDVVKSLAWPDDVVEQWLYGHSGFGQFLMDCGGLDLTAIHWHDELVPARAVPHHVDRPIRGWTH